MIGPAVVIFVLLAAVAAGSALMVVLTANVVRAAVWLLFCLLAVGGLYFLLGAEFIGAVQLIVYVGGTMVLVVFGVMLTAQGPGQRLRVPLWERLAAGATALGLFTAIALSLTARPWPGREPTPPATITQIGSALLGDPAATPEATLPMTPAEPRQRVAYVFPFEVASVHLLVVLIGAAYLARAKRRQPPPTLEEPR